MGLYNENEKMLDETRLVVNLLLNNVYNDKEIAKRSGIDIDKVGYYLTNHGLIISAFCFDPNDTKERMKAEKIYESVQSIRARIDQTREVKEEIPLANPNAKVNLGLLYKDEKKQIKFLISAILTFRVKLETLSELLNLDKDIISKKIYKYSSQYYESLNYLFYSDYYNQEIARKNFLNFYYQLLKAKKENNIEEINKCISMIDDSKINQLLNKVGEIKFTDEEIEIIVKFQLKYAIQSTLMTNILQYNNRSAYYRRIVNFFDRNPQLEDLKNRYEELMNYHNPILNKGTSR